LKIAGEGGLPAIETALETPCPGAVFIAMRGVERILRPLGLLAWGSADGKPWSWPRRICPTNAGWWRGRRSRDARVNEYSKVQKDKRT
jgi:hypothetical protein